MGESLDTTVLLRSLVDWNDIVATKDHLEYLQYLGPPPDSAWPSGRLRQTFEAPIGALPQSRLATFYFSP